MTHSLDLILTLSPAEISNKVPVTDRRLEVHHLGREGFMILPKSLRNEHPQTLSPRKEGLL